jgi:putative PIN family toxin of toxin-antitoxin system
VLHRPKLARFLDQDLRDELLDLLLSAAVWFEPTERVTDCRDAKDDKYLELALAARAGVIVSSDDDLLMLNPWRGVRILRPTEYLRGD